MLGFMILFRSSTNPSILAMGSSKTSIGFTISLDKYFDTCNGTAFKCSIFILLILKGGLVRSNICPSDINIECTITL